VLAADRVSVFYAKVPAVRQVSMAVRPGEIVALVGANGAGKSTLLKAAHGLVDDVDGEISLDGASLRPRTTQQRVDAGLALVPEGRHVFAAMTVDENLDLGFRASAAGDMEPRRQAIFGRFPRLAERRTQKAGTLSGGEQQMLAIGRALMSAPRVMMLDEPTLGLAPMVIQQVAVLLRQLRDEGMAILLAEQNVRMALSCADRAYVVRNGEIVAEGSAAELRSSAAIRQAYLGLR
jgi:branched-chain amino acid transport system ATP-binding protein